MKVSDGIVRANTRLAKVASHRPPTIVWSPGFEAVLARGAFGSQDSASFAVFYPT